MVLINLCPDYSYSTIVVFDKRGSLCNRCGAPQTGDTLEVGSFAPHTPFGAVLKSDEVSTLYHKRPVTVPMPFLANRASNATALITQSINTFVSPVLISRRLCVNAANPTPLLKHWLWLPVVMWDRCAVGSFYVQQVNNILASLMHRDPDHRMRIEEFRALFASVPQLWESETPQGQQEQYDNLSPLPDTTVEALDGIEVILVGTVGEWPEWIHQCTDWQGEPFWQKIDKEEDGDGEVDSSNAIGTIGDVADDDNSPPPLVDDSDDEIPVDPPGDDEEGDRPPPLVGDSDDE